MLVIKEDHKLLYQDIKDYFHHAPFLEEIKQLNKGYVCTIEKSHSQIEKRSYYQTDDISWLEAQAKWEGVKSIGMVEKIMEKDDELRVEKRCFIC